MSEPAYLTKEGLARLKEELERLKGPDRDALSSRLRDAISQGDLSENADYSKAKEDQAFLEGRIQELDYLVNNAVIIEEGGRHDQVEVGATVTVQEAGEEPETYYMVGAKEADPPNGRISNESPIGRALLGCRAGDSVTVETPGGALKLKILKIE